MAALGLDHGCAQPGIVDTQGRQSVERYAALTHSLRWALDQRDNERGLDVASARSVDGHHCGQVKG
jgi:hypothetical protein